MVDLQRFRLPGLERRFSRTPRNRALLVILRTGKRPKTFLKESREEMSELASAAAIQVLDVLEATLPHPSPSHFVRKGKLDEIAKFAKRLKANVILFNVELTPTQASNIEKVTDTPTLDRTGLILDIFGKRARSKEGKLQVELAQLQYALPHIGGLGEVMSRLGAGIGSRGPGEQELERDRRKVRRRIQQVKTDLKRVQKHRQLLREGRKKRNFLSVAIVGYTNAGKSTLLNALTGAQAYAEDKLFATLDPLTRRQTLDGRHDILFIDTVGFIRELPHTLVESFHATLEEVIEADVLIVVLDASDTKATETLEAVQKVLQEIKIGQKLQVLALNKADLMSEEEQQRVQARWPESILISAKNGWGLHGIMAKLDELVPKN